MNIVPVLSLIEAELMAACDDYKMILYMIDIIITYCTIGLNWPTGFSKPSNSPKMKFRMERSLKLKVVCTWGFDLKVDFDEVMEVTS
jgi:hypothetical protein